MIVVCIVVAGVCLLFAVSPNGWLGVCLVLAH